MPRISRNGLFVGLMFISCLTSAQDPADIALKQNYLRANISTLDMNDNDDFSSFAMLDSVLNRYHLYFTGEQHYTEGDFEVKWKVLKYLYQKAGVKILVIEHPPSYAYLLDHYMEKKDSVQYNQMVDYAPEGTKERIFYRNLYEFNKTKPREEQIRVTGVDIDYVKVYSTRALKEMINQRADKKEAFVRIQWEVGQMHAGKLKADSLLKKVAAEENTYKDFFGEEFKLFKRILWSISCECEPPSERKMDDPRWFRREEFMYRNYLSLMEEFPASKMYGQFGAKHISLLPASHWYNGFNWTSIAAKLNTRDSSMAKGKVLSILLSYAFEWNSPKGEKRLFNTTAAGQSFTLFKINNANSPFTMLSSHVHYLININYGEEQEMQYNQENDTYNIMDDEQYTMGGPVFGYQYWDRGVFSAGTEVRARYLKENKYLGGLGLHFELNTKGPRMHGYRLGMWFGGNIQAGVNFVYNTNYKRSAFFFRPEIAIARNLFSVGYGYNVTLYNKYLNEGINKHMLIARMFLPWWKD